MKMTEEGAEKFLTDPTSADRVIADTLEQKARADWPLPRYLLEHLDELAARP